MARKDYTERVKRARIGLILVFIGLIGGSIYLILRDKAPRIPAKSDVPKAVLSRYDDAKTHDIHSLRLCTVSGKKIYQVVRSNGFAREEYYYNDSGQYLGSGSGDDVGSSSDEYDVQPPVRVNYRNCTDLNY